MNNRKTIRIGFFAVGLYDGILGSLFTLMPLRVFDWYGVTPPNHRGYVQFPALLLLIFALMFFAVARNPANNRNLIPYGILLKAAYSGLVFAYWFGPGIPGMWKPFAVIDLLTVPFLAWAFIDLGREPEAVI